MTTKENIRLSELRSQLEELQRVYVNLFQQYEGLSAQTGYTPLVVTPVNPPTVWELGPQIGQGQYGTVHALVDSNNRETDTLRQWCVKQLNTSTDSKKRLALRESQLVRDIPTHENLLKYFPETRGEVTYLLMRRSYDGSLKNRIDNRMFSAESAINVAWAILSALEALSNASVIHRDIHTGNIMFFGNVIKLIDMGLAREQEGESGSYTAYQNPSRPIAPEMATNDGHTSKIDIFDFGWLCKAMSDACIDSEVVKDALDKMWKACSVPDPNNRPDVERAKRLLEHYLDSSKPHPDAHLYADTHSSLHGTGWFSNLSEAEQQRISQFITDIRAQGTESRNTTSVTE